MASVHTSTSIQDERIMAALAHAAIIVPGMGLVAPIVIWVTQREKSRYVRFQALQATLYHGLLILLYFIGMGCYLFSIFGMLGFAGLIEGSGGSPDPVLNGGFVLPILVLGGVMLFGLALVLGGMVGAVQSLRGQDFRYPLLGRWLEKRYRDG